MIDKFMLWIDELLNVDQELVVQWNVIVEKQWCVDELMYQVECLCIEVMWELLRLEEWVKQCWIFNEIDLVKFWVGY